MSPGVRLRWPDVDAAIDVVGEAAVAEEPFGIGLIETLIRLIPADRAGYYEFDSEQAGSGAGVNTYSCEQPQFDFPWKSDEVVKTISSWPLLDSRVCASTRAIKLSDFLTRSEQRRNPWYVEVQRGLGVEYECKLFLAARPPTVGAFFFVRGRDGRDFDERDRDLLTLLRPHLSKIRDRWERRRSASARLTPREIEVLRLAAAGLTNSEIASRLVISPATVRTHLENTFEKLDVHTRTAAVAAAFGGAHCS